MEKFERKAQVDEVDTFSFDDASWLDGEAINTFTVTQDGALVDVLNTSYSGTIVTAQLKGLSAGGAKLHYHVTTATRSHCIDALVIVLPAC